MLELSISAPSMVQGIAVERPEGRELWLANLTGKDQQVLLPALTRRIAVLNASRFVEASQTPDLLDQLISDSSTELTLNSFAVARIQLT